MYVVAEVGKAVHHMLVIQAFRPDRLLASAHLFVQGAVGQQFMHAADQEMDLANIIENEVCCVLYDIKQYQNKCWSFNFLEYFAAVETNVVRENDKK